MAEAISAAKNGVKFGDTSGDANDPWVSRVALADALHQAGQADEALALFQEAEAMQAEIQSNPSILYSVWGYRYCDLLFAMGQTDQVLDRAFAALHIYEDNNQYIPLDIGNDNLTIGRAYSACGDHKLAKMHFNDAINELRQAGAEEFLVRGLVARAANSRVLDAYSFAATDLDEANDIANRGEMRLLLADIHLETARLSLARLASGETASHSAAEAHTQMAAKFINATNYRRRLNELAALRACLTGDIAASILAPDRDVQGRSVWHDLVPSPSPASPSPPKSQRGFFSRLFDRKHPRKK
jgi:tetratricopeptide (TPR) repeat protein